MPDQPAPDFEEARRRVADEIQVQRRRYVPGTPERYPGTPITIRLTDAEALLNEREAREKVFGKYVLAIMRAPGNRDDAEIEAAAAALARSFGLPATESASAEGERRRG